MPTDDAQRPTHEEEEEEEEESDDGEPPAGFEKFAEGAAGSRGRTSVSAEAYGQWNKKEAFTPPVHDKSDAAAGRLREVLGKSFLFQQLSVSELATVIGAMEEERCAAGHRLIEQGDNGESLFVVEEGSVDCFKNCDGAEKLVKTCSRGDAFGELALLYNCPRAASVVAKEACVIWKLDRKTFNYIVKDAAAKKRDTYDKFLQSVELFAAMDAYERMQMADAFVEQNFAVGDTLITQGEDKGDRFYLVVHGTCEAIKDGANVMAYKEGDYFGERSLLTDQPRAATIKATSALQVVFVERKTFKRMLGPLEDIMKRRADSYC